MTFSRNALIPLCAVLTGVMALGGATTAAQAYDSKADNFVLLDHTGKARELRYFSDHTAVVVTAQQNRCEDNAAHVSKALQLVQDRDGVAVLMINTEDARPDLAANVPAEADGVYLLQDTTQIISRSFEFTHAGDTVVVNPKDWSVAYQGDLEGATRAAIALNGEQVPATLMPVSLEGPASNCPINYAPQPADAPDYVADIVPLLERNCMACHQEGGIGPWAMSSYEMVLGFSPMMREVVRTKRMPPWHADPEVGHWQNSAAMSIEDTRTLVSWIEAGSPRGEGDDPLLTRAGPDTEWPLGVPDLILEIPEFTVPASGIVDYTFPVVPNPMQRDVWVKAATIIPGDARVVHHVLMGSAEQAPQDTDRESVFQNYIMGYAPGNESEHMPEGTGVKVPVGGVFLFQMHYTPVGIETTDRTKVGLYFADEMPDNFLRHQVVLNPAIKIPPNEANHVEEAYFEFWDDATIYNLIPHSHYRGKSSEFELFYPDGKREVVLSVPNYDFNWQRTYSFVEPKEVPKGTRIVHRTVYDNSAKNARNPNPDREVPWGLQSHDEMLYGAMSYAWKSESSEAPNHSNLSADVAQFIGFKDADWDGKLQKAELPNGMRERLGWFKWWFVDTNFDGALDQEELEVMFSR